MPIYIITYAWSVGTSTPDMTEFKLKYFKKGGIYEGEIFVNNSLIYYLTYGTCFVS